MKTLVLSVPYPWFFSLVAPIFNTFSSLFWFEFQIFKKNYIYIFTLLFLELFSFSRISWFLISKSTIFS